MTGMLARRIGRAFHTAMMPYILDDDDLDDAARDTNSELQTTKPEIRLLWRVAGRGYYTRHHTLFSRQNIKQDKYFDTLVKRPNLLFQDDHSDGSGTCRSSSKRLILDMNET